MSWPVEMLRLIPRDTSQSNILGVILYTNSHVHLKKTLNDIDYWKALDEDSGKQWTVFAAAGHPGQREITGGGPGTIGMLVAKWKEPSENRFLLEAFELKSTEDLPALVVFAVHQEMILRKAFKIDASSQESAHGCLSRYFKAVSCVISRIDTENLKAEDRPYTLVQRELDRLQSWDRVKNCVALYSWLRSLAP